MKQDLKTIYKDYYSTKKTVQLVTLGSYSYLSIQFHGDPNKEPFMRNVQALFTVAYTLKFIYKKADKDFVVAPLEGFWWFNDGIQEKENTSRDNWNYQILTMLPPFVSDDAFQEALAQAMKKKPELKEIKSIKKVMIHEERVVQMLHVGPFAEEHHSKKILLEFMKKNNLTQNGISENRIHHEIYLSDSRKTPPLKLRTILRFGIK